MRSSALACLCLVLLATLASASAHAPNSTRQANDVAWPDTIWHDIKWFWLHPFYDYSPPNPTAKPPALHPPTPDCVNAPNQRNCWTPGGYDINTDPYASWPETGVTRSYVLEIRNSTGAPDGVERPMLLVNGQYPGPTIYANWGDWVEVSVTNYMQDNGTGVHWHGIRQWYTSAEDGVPGVTECPIAPGHTKVYRWQATQYGTSWWHSHWSVQYGDGIAGSIVVYGPSTANYDIDLGPLPFTDWYYETVSARSYIVAHTYGRPPTEADTGLINGTMVSESGGHYYTTPVTKGKRYKLRLINMSIDNNFAVSLDDHPFLVIGANFSPIQPYLADWVFVAIGQRYDVVIETSQEVGSYWFRAEVQDQPVPDCGRNANNGNIRSIFRYDGASKADLPTSSPTKYVQRCSDEVFEPYFNTSVPGEPLKTAGQLDTAIHFGANVLNQTIVKWGLDTTPIYLQWSGPTLEKVYDGNLSFAAAANVLEVDGEGSWSYWIMQEVPGTPISVSIPHPIHLHGHDFFVLGHGVGNFSSTGGSTLNFVDPVRRDTAMMPAAGWLVVAFIVDNPGAWLMHCHIAWHAAQGMGVQFLEMAGNISEIAEPVHGFGETCESWREYYPEHAAYLRDADDSGI